MRAEVFSNCFGKFKGFLTDFLLWDEIKCCVYFNEAPNCDELKSNMGILTILTRKIVMKISKFNLILNRKLIGNVN